MGLARATKHAEFEFQKALLEIELNRAEKRKCDKFSISRRVR